MQISNISFLRTCSHCCFKSTRNVKLKKTKKNTGTNFISYWPHHPPIVMVSCTELPALLGLFVSICIFIVRCIHFVDVMIKFVVISFSFCVFSFFLFVFCDAFMYQQSCCVHLSRSHLPHPFFFCWFLGDVTAFPLFNLITPRRFPGSCSPGRRTFSAHSADSNSPTRSL